SADSFPRLAMAIVRMQPCLVDLQWRLLADNTELTSWASNCKHARRFDNQEYRGCKPAQPTCTPAPRCARQHLAHARMHVDVHAGTWHMHACMSMCAPGPGTCTHAGRCARQHLAHARMHVGLHASTRRMLAWTPICKPARHSIDHVRCNLRKPERGYLVGKGMSPLYGQTEVPPMQSLRRTYVDSNFRSKA